MSLKKNSILISTILSSSILFSSVSAFAMNSTYKVKSGDTLRKISIKYHTTWRKLARLNNIKSPYIIYPNQILKLQANAQIPKPTITYKVKSGDTLRKISIKYHTTWRNLARLNNIKSPYIIYPNQILKLQANAQIPKPTIVTPTAPVNKPKPTPIKKSITQKDLNEHLVMAELWMQTSAEYRALCYQAYNTAKTIVDQNVAKFKKGDKPLALITDCDETIIENSIYDAGFIDHNDSHNDDNWVKWVNAAKGKAMPGAKEFLNYAHSKGVEIFYVTGRDEKNSLDGTMNNLKKVGFPCVDKYHMRLQTTTGNKEPRMQEIQKKYNVIIYMGDDEGDFPVGSYHKDMNSRNSLVDKNKSNFGSKFIALPNPSYGHWESSLAKDYWNLTPEQKNVLRKQLIKRWRAN